MTTNTADTDQNTDYDSPWKEALDRYLAAFLALCFPAIHAAIDWSRGHEFLDKELQQVVREAEQGRQLVDKLVKVWQHDGAETWVLIHIEVQGQPEVDFAERMYRYHYRLFDRYHRPVVSLAVLSDARRTWRPREHVSALWGCEIRFRFPIVKLLDYNGQWDKLEQSDNPFAVVVMAHLTALATRRKPASRLEEKLRLVRRLYERGYARADVLELFRFIDWLLVLPDAAERQFRTLLYRYEEDRAMTYVTSIERDAIQQGLEQGRELGLEQGLEQGLREAILATLEVRFAVTPDDIASALNQVSSVATLKALQRQAITIPSLDQFRQLLTPSEPAA